MDYLKTKIVEIYEFEVFDIIRREERHHRDYGDSTGWATMLCKKLRIAQSPLNLKTMRHMYFKYKGESYNEKFLKEIKKD